MADDIIDRLRDLAEVQGDAADAIDEIEALRAELRRFQRIVIDSSDGTADCEDLCSVLCAGPCQGIVVPAGVTHG